VDAPVISSGPASVNWRSSVLDYPTEPRATEAIETLIYSFEELLRRLPAASDSEMRRLRDQAANALAAAKAAVAEHAARAAQLTHPLATAYLNEYVRESPRAALGVAAVLGLAIGFWSGWSGRSARWRW
jgi:ElaB/YqjD/DUF883 family membrane-anchored ribosome-binding protein